MNILTNDRLEEIIEKRSPSLRWEEAPEMAREILSLRTQLAGLREQEPFGYVVEKRDGSGVKFFAENDEQRLFRNSDKITPCYAHPTPPAMPDSGVTAEHQRVIGLLLGVCGAAFELADDTCQQEVDGELCHVVPDSSFSRLSDWLDEIENTLPDQYDDLPNTVLQFGAVPRHALRAILQLSGNSEQLNSPAIPDDTELVVGNGDD